MMFSRLHKDAIRTTVLRYRIVETGVALALLACVVAFLHLIVDIELPLSFYIPGLAAWLIMIATGNYNQGRNEYWVRPEFRSNAEQALAEAGYYKVVDAGEKTLYEKRFRLRREFATIANSEHRILLDIAGDYDKIFDKHILPHMLDGGGRHYKRLFPKAWQREKRASAI